MCHGGTAHVIHIKKFVTDHGIDSFS